MEKFNGFYQNQVKRITVWHVVFGTIGWLTLRFAIWGDWNCPSKVSENLLWGAVVVPFFLKQIGAMVTSVILAIRRPHDKDRDTSTKEIVTLTNGSSGAPEAAIIKEYIFPLIINPFSWLYMWRVVYTTAINGGASDHNVNMVRWGMMGPLLSESPRAIEAEELVLFGKWGKYSQPDTDQPPQRGLISDTFVKAMMSMAITFTNSAATKDQVARIEEDVADLREGADNRKSAVTKFVMKHAPENDEFILRVAAAVAELIADRVEPDAKLEKEA